MPSYKIFKEDKLLGHTNIASCDCAVFKLLGTDISGNIMLYDPTLHTIKECNTTMPLDLPPYMPTPIPGTWLGSCLPNNKCDSGLKCIDLSNNVVTGKKACMTDIYPSFWPSKSYLAHYDIVNKSCKLCIDFPGSICPPDVKTLPMQECCARTGDTSTSASGCGEFPWEKIPGAGWCFSSGRDFCIHHPLGKQNYIDCKTNYQDCPS